MDFRHLYHWPNQHHQDLSGTDPSHHGVTESLTSHERYLKIPLTASLRTSPKFLSNRLLQQKYATVAVRRPSQKWLTPKVLYSGGQNAHQGRWPTLAINCPPLLTATITVKDHYKKIKNKKRSLRKRLLAAVKEKLPLKKIKNNL